MHLFELCVDLSFFCFYSALAVICLISWVGFFFCFVLFLFFFGGGGVVVKVNSFVEAKCSMLFFFLFYYLFSLLSILHSVKFFCFRDVRKERCLLSQWIFLWFVLFGFKVVSFCHLISTFVLFFTSSSCSCCISKTWDCSESLCTSSQVLIYDIFSCLL